MNILDNAVLNYCERKEETQYESNYMTYEKTFSDICTQLLENIRIIRQEKNKNEKLLFEYSTYIYFLIPSIIGSALNYKVTVEQGLRMHPKEYVDLNEKNHEYSQEERTEAHHFFVNSLHIGRKIMNLGDTLEQEMETFIQKTPDKLKNFLYSSTIDEYTYLSYHPKRIKKLSNEIITETKKPYIIGIAHGAILPSIALASLMNSESYTIRFSQYKREDKMPIISETDKEELEKVKNRDIILIDEDLATGKTISNLKQKIEKIIKKRVKTASVLLAQTSKHIPNFYCDYVRL